MELSTVHQSWAKTESDNLQVFQSDIQNELNKFNKEQTVFQNELQELIAEAKNQQTKDSAEYCAKLQKYGSEIQSYQAQVNKDVQTYQQNLRWVDVIRHRYIMENIPVHYFLFLATFFYHFFDFQIFLDLNDFSFFFLGFCG